jgi:Ca2+-binding RTX toxin-like protein
MSDDIQSSNNSPDSSNRWRSELKQRYSPNIATFTIFRYMDGGTYSTSVLSPYNYNSYYRSADDHQVAIYKPRTVGLGSEDNLVFVGANGLVDINTGGGNDFLIAVRRSARLDADLGSGNDFAVGGWQNDTIKGGSGDDFIDGAFGDDSILGGSGNDTLYGSDGNDSLIGNDGDDNLYSGKGNDRLWGGNGADYFVFNEDDYQTRSLRQTVTIEDFGRGNDLIDLRSFDFKAVGNEITDRRFRIFEDNGFAHIVINAVPQTGIAELHILVKGMSYDKFVAGTDTYMNYVLV